MKLLRILAVAAIPVALAGCAPGVNNDLPPSKEYVKPPIGQLTTVYMGEPVLKSATGFYADALVLGSAKGVYSRVAAGTYCNVRGNIYRNLTNPQAVGLTDLYGNVVSYMDFVTYDAAKNTISPPNGTSYNSTEISIKREPQQLCMVSNAFVRSIEYNGNAAGVMKFTYREFANDMARQAFTTDFTVDSKGSDIVTYKGARIKVISADNSSIKFTVLSGFDTQDKF